MSIGIKFRYDGLHQVFCCFTFSSFFYIFISMRNKIGHLNHSEELKLLYESVHVSHDWSLHKLLNRHHLASAQFQICFRGRILWILVLSVWKNIEFSIFYKHFMKNPTIDFFEKWGSECGYILRIARLIELKFLVSIHRYVLTLFIVKFLSKSVDPLGLYNICKKTSFFQ